MIKSNELQNALKHKISSGNPEDFQEIFGLLYESTQESLAPALLKYSQDVKNYTQEELKEIRCFTTQRPALFVSDAAGLGGIVTATASFAAAFATGSQAAGWIALGSLFVGAAGIAARPYMTPHSQRYKGIANAQTEIQETINGTPLIADVELERLEFLPPQESEEPSMDDYV